MKRICTVLVLTMAILATVAYSSTRKMDSLKAFSADSKVNLYWAECVDALSYQVFRSNTAGFEDEKLLAENSELELTDSSVMVGEEYHYRIVAVIAENEKVESNVANVKVFARPTSVTASVTPEDNKNVVEWKHPEESSPVFGYRVYRGTSETVDTSGLAYVELGSGFSSFIDDLDTVNGTTYFYKIVAYNEWGDGLASKIVSATPCDECKK